mmetsp:Transcript_98309/g.179587  ORF Transcript_98309/g.179587 Transcript_98309/m.179587 type:complete len:106 (+) Transcript_98309:971-1288(+)
MLIFSLTVVSLQQHGDMHRSSSSSTSSPCTPSTICMAVFSLRERDAQQEPEPQRSDATVCMLIFCVKLASLHEQAEPPIHQGSGDGISLGDPTGKNYKLPHLGQK